MKEYCSAAFRNVDDKEFEAMLACRCMRERRYGRGDTIFRSGDRVHEIGVVRSGSVHIENSDLWGNRSILGNIEAGQVFAETYALCGEPMMVDAVAAEESVVLFIDLHVLLNAANYGKTWYPKLLQNLLAISTQKNLVLSQRIFCTTAKTVRGRLLTYLSAQALKNGSNEFVVPFDRQQMADYLNLDRSALSKELCRMRDEGMLVFHKNSFRLIRLGT